MQEKQKKQFLSDFTKHIQRFFTILVNFVWLFFFLLYFLLRKYKILMFIQR